MTGSDSNRHSLGARLLRMFLFALAGFILFAVVTYLIAVGIALVLPMSPSTQLVIAYMVVPILGLVGALIGLWKASH